LRKIIPVISRFSPQIKINDNGAYVKDKAGTITWVYDGKQVTGKGIFVAGTARSGTMYISKVLQELGYKVGHEQSDEDGSVGYHLAVIKPDNCFHQVRHPLKQISSQHAHQAWGFMDSFIEIEGYGLRGCMQYWLKWNELLEEFCVWRYRVENLPNVWPEFLERIGHEQVSLPDISTTTNTHRKVFATQNTLYVDYDWDNLFRKDRELAQKIQDKAIEYGYTVPEEARRIAGSNEKAREPIKGLTASL